MTIYTFKNPLPRRIQIFKNIFKIFENKVFIQGKLKMSKFSLKTSAQKSLKNFFAKIVQSA